VFYLHVNTAYVLSEGFLFVFADVHIGWSYSLSVRCSYMNCVDPKITISLCGFIRLSIAQSFKDITQWWTLAELCHKIITVTSIHMVRPCCTGHHLEPLWVMSLRMGCYSCAHIEYKRSERGLTIPWRALALLVSFFKHLSGRPYLICAQKAIESYIYIIVRSWWCI